MSYARFLYTDVYVYADVNGGFTCCGCSMNDFESSNFSTPRAIIDHLALHDAEGEYTGDAAVKIAKDYPEETRVS